MTLQDRLRGLRSGTSTREFVVIAIGGAALTAIGLLMTFSASFVQSAAATGDPFGIFTRQLLGVAVGLPLAVVAALVDYRVWRRLATPLVLVSLFALALVLVPSMGTEVNHARRWFDFGPLNLQPSELVKPALALWAAHVVASRWARVRAGDLRALLVPLPVTLIAAALVYVAPDLESALLVGLIGVSVLYVAGMPIRLMVGFGGLLLAIGVAGILSVGYRQDRMRVWLDPTAYASDIGYQTTQGLIALGSGGWLGAGLGQGRGKWLYIPNAHTDFIFAIVGEELGLVGALVVLALFGAIAVAGVRTSRRAPDPFGRLLAAGITTWILAQAAINIASVVGLLPVTGVTLPLVSFGGSSLAFTMFGLGLLASVARNARRPEEHGPVAARRPVLVAAGPAADDDDAAPW